MANEPPTQNPSHSSSYSPPHPADVLNHMETHTLKSSNSLLLLQHFPTPIIIFDLCTFYVTVIVAKQNRILLQHPALIIPSYCVQAFCCTVHHMTSGAAFQNISGRQTISFGCCVSAFGARWKESNTYMHYPTHYYCKPMGYKGSSVFVQVVTFVVQGKA